MICSRCDGQSNAVGGVKAGLMSGDDLRIAGLLGELRSEKALLPFLTVWTVKWKNSKGRHTRHEEQSEL